MIEPGSEDGNRPSFGRQRSLVRGGIDTSGQTAYDRDPRIGYLIREALCALQPVVGGPARTDYAQRVVIPFFDLTPDIQDQRRIINLPEQRGIDRIILRDNGSPKLPNPLELGWQVEFFLPVQQGVDRVPWQPFHPAEFRSFSLQDTLRFSKHLEKLSNPYRSYVRYHIQRNQSFGSSHTIDSRRHSTADSRSVRVIFSETNAAPNPGVNTNRI